MNKFQKSCLRRQGFTLAEVLIVISIIIILTMFGLMNIRGQMAHATDAKRKSDLYTLSKSFEDYYNDHSVFPNQSVVNDCGGTMAPYIKTIPCDPVSNTHYGYFPSVNGGYRICARLTDTTDPAIAASNCLGNKGCGLGGPPSGGVYNYCLGTGVTASAVDTDDEIIGGTPPPVGGGTPTPTPVGGGTPPPTLDPNNHRVCTKGGACNVYDHPELHGCPISWLVDCPDYKHFPETPFSGACGDSANRCAD
jgi:prepilin-type N-terminal cleavage/methylation domain-containing protein